MLKACSLVAGARIAISYPEQLVPFFDFDGSDERHQNRKEVN